MSKRNKKERCKEVKKRSKDNRQEEVRTIINKLTELGLTMAHEEIKLLMFKMQLYIQGEGRIVIDIPFSTIGRRIRGVLPSDENEEVWLKLENDD